MILSSHAQVEELLHVFIKCLIKKYSRHRSNKSLASMGYGISAIGAAFSDKNRRVIHIEGDGGLFKISPPSPLFLITT